MKFRTRLVLTLSALTAVTSFASFGLASFVVERSEERQLDEALVSEAHSEAAELASQRAPIHVNGRGGAPADDIGRLKDYSAIYGPDGKALDITSTFANGAPTFDAVRHPPGTTFDLWYGTEHLRAVLVPIPDHAGLTLMLGAPRSDMEKDNTFLREVMTIAALLSLAVTVFVTWRVVRRLTRGHEAIAEAARLVADGDLDARVALTHGDDEVVQLAHDVDEMVRRLALLVEGQQRFVAHAAHELRSPLTALYGELQLALRRSRSAEEYKLSIEEALDSARRLKALAEDLLALARIGSERDAPNAPVALGEVAKSATSWVASEAARRHVEIAVVADGSTVIGHAIDLERLLRNLLDNAIRHCPEGGHVWLDARSEGDDVLVSVADDGPGVPEEERARVFEPFYRAPSQRQRDDGSGLGLAIVREIARVHGGDVTVTEREGGPGACFRARLPAAPG